MANEYQVVAVKPSGKVMYWSYTGFTANQAHVAKMISLDFAALTGAMEQRDHPTWDVKLRISEAA